ncbi:MarR family transcriptional regulator [Hyphomonas polymorpha PS728]|uniref:MarR family transcriptional regulator n=1 Tax=Hyphomonas polymorpha PS728 TaxID=1280954 RepID=A0A062VBY8_9PROT|nr:MarR family transcriptional regulator [Hyphomonas polymorpha]KCZ96832.1 MarR family transcriptional regulator [Hyphomonas polymorpha PS728]
MTKKAGTESPYSEWSNSLGYLVRKSFRSVSRALEARTSAYGVTASQWHFLRVLWIEDGISQRELSQRVSMREPTTVIAVKRLEKAGLITRKQSSEDGRKINIFLTPKARALKAKLMPLVEEVNELATKGLTAKEKSELRRLLTKVNQNLESEDRMIQTPAPPP